jgi:hypothetical protein
VSLGVILGLIGATMALSLVIPPKQEAGEADTDTSADGQP